MLVSVSFCFFFADTASSESYTLSLHDALPIFLRQVVEAVGGQARVVDVLDQRVRFQELGNPLREYVKDRKSTRLNSSHRCISYAVFCLKKKKKTKIKRQSKKIKSVTIHHYTTQ